MEYFELIQDKDVENPMRVLNIDTKRYTYFMNAAHFDALDRLKVAYSSGIGCWDWIFVKQRLFKSRLYEKAAQKWGLLWTKNYI